MMMINKLIGCFKKIFQSSLLRYMCNYSIVETNDFSSKIKWPDGTTQRVSHREMIFYGHNNIKKRT